MATAAVIAAAAIGAAGSIGGAALSARGASAAAGAGAGQARTIPLPGYAAAINHIAAREAVVNQHALPPSFDTFVKSGGTATFPFETADITPQEYTQLGFVGKQGQPIPFITPGQKELTSEQKMFLGAQRYWNTWNAGGNIEDKLAFQYAKAHGLNTIQPKTSGGGFLGTLTNILSGGQGNSDIFLGGIAKKTQKHTTPAKKGY